MYLYDFLLNVANKDYHYNECIGSYSIGTSTSPPMERFTEMPDRQRKVSPMKRLMPCRWRKLIPLSMRYATNGINGNRQRESTSQNGMAKSVHLVYPFGATNFLRK